MTNPDLCPGLHGGYSVSLTEAATYIINGEALTPAQVALVFSRDDRARMRKWGRDIGPDEDLLFDMSLVAEERLPDAGVETYAVLCGIMSPRRRRNPEAVAKVAAAYVSAGRAWLDRQQNGDPDPWETLMGVLFEDYCQRHDEVIKGIRRDHERGNHEGGATFIPRTFFTYSAFCDWVGDTLTALRPRDSLGNTRLDLLMEGDAPETYMNPMISREHIEQVKLLYREKMEPVVSGGDKRRKLYPDDDLGRRFKAIVEYVKKRWSGKARRPSLPKMAQHLIEQKKTHGFDEQILRKVIAGTYGPMKDRKIPGIDGPKGNVT